MAEYMTVRNPLFVESIDEGDGTSIEIRHMADPESPRTMSDNVGTFLTWARGYNSPDPNGWKDGEEWLVDMLQERFTFEELVAAVKAERFCDVRFRTDKRMKVYLTASCEWAWSDGKWRLCDSFNEYQDHEELAKVIACSEDALGFLEERMLILEVHMLEHSGVAYSCTPFHDHWDAGAVGVIYADAEKLEAEHLTREEGKKLLIEEVETYSMWAQGDVYEIEAIDEDLEILATIDHLYGYESAVMEIGTLRLEAEAALEAKREALAERRRQTQNWKLSQEAFEWLDGEEEIEDFFCTEDANGMPCVHGRFSERCGDLGKSFKLSGVKSGTQASPRDAVAEILLWHIAWADGDGARERYLVLQRLAETAPLGPMFDRR